MTRHKMAPTATAALGRTLLGAALLGAFRKEEEQLQVCAGVLVVVAAGAVARCCAEAAAVDVCLRPVLLHAA
jgi:redox-regulated HSP33 family molecular chaperone